MKAQFCLSMKMFYKALFSPSILSLIFGFVSVGFLLWGSTNDFGLEFESCDCRRWEDKTVLCKNG